LFESPLAQAVQLTLLADKGLALRKHSPIFINSTLFGINTHLPGLQGLRLNDCNLRGIDLELADLRKAQLQLANLSWATLNGANLKSANLRRVDLSHAALEGAALNNATLLGADFSFANLKGVDLSETHIDKNTCFDFAETDARTRVRTTDRRYTNEKKHQCTHTPCV
jgi:uncharacterized protein YjbI with pentapeptide repeats